ncbi:unnamed protein product [Phytomonas sp. EM1]|nr:unnamed protein product [Phytomonas sp. EM1]|eukprot:CCW62314.1 unnamed protein product [Phytomonas sp. isolate EM1]
MSSTTVVVEVACTAPRSDWLELSCLLCSFLRHYASDGCDAAHAELSSLFAPGRCIPLTAWTLAEATMPAISSLLQRVVRSMRVCDMCDFYPPKDGGDAGTRNSSSAAAYASGVEEISFVPILYTLHSGDAVDDPSREAHPGRGCHDDDNGANPPPCSILLLPHESLDGLWESLYYGDSLTDSARLKVDLVEYVRTALTFSLAGVDPHAIVWNRLVLLHGPPGTGKTSLCKALAQKLAIRLGHLFPYGARLIEVNAHSLFSRWFSESGKQVMQLFRHIVQLASDERGLVCVLIDEVESLAAARQSAMKGNEPTDSIRVVNTLLTQIDHLIRFNNVLVLATSNLTDAIDEAFLDRVDKKIFLGPPGLKARTAMLYSGVVELLRSRLVCVDQDSQHQPNVVRDDTSTCTLGFTPHYFEEVLLPECAAACIIRIADLCVDLNGRMLRKLPFLAYGACVSSRREFRVQYASTLSLSLSKTCASEQKILQPTSASLYGNVNPDLEHGRSGNLHIKVTETSIEEETNEEPANSGLAKKYLEAFPVLPLSVFLDFLSKAARKVTRGDAES